MAEVLHQVFEKAALNITLLVFIIGCREAFQLDLSMPLVQQEKTGWVTTNGRHRRGLFKCRPLSSHMVGG